ncbi:MAG: DUF4249 family protein [Bacteroidetes bacterium]|nr:MAG: DUF4249 family protein [Bacteroidota bacterium]
MPGESYYMINLYKVSIPDSQTFASVFTSGSGLPTQIYSDKLYTDPVIRDTISYQGFAPGDTVAVALSHVSKGYYEFLSARQRSNSSIFVTLLKEPVSYSTNVTGGYGFFTLHVPAIRLFILE